MTTSKTASRKAAPARAAKRLRNLELDEVSVVTVPANAGAGHVFHKSAAKIAKTDAAGDDAGGGGGGGDTPPADAAGQDTPPPGGGDDSAAQVEQLTAALAEKDAQIAALALRVSELTPDGSKAADTLPDDTTNSPPEKPMTTQNPPAKDAAAKVDKAATPGAADTVDVAKMVADAVKAETADLRKALETAEGRVTAAENVAKAEKAARELTEFTKAAEGPDFKNLPGEPIAKAKALQAVAALGDEERKTLEAALKAGNAAMGRRFGEIGKSGEGQGGGAGGGGTAEAELNELAKGIQTAKGVTFAKAYAAAITENPEVYARYQREHAARARTAGE